MNQFIVNESDIYKREEFYDYITNYYNIEISYPYYKEKFINNTFPFVIDFENNNFWICESITCCACASQAKIIYTIDEFKELTENKIVK